MNTMQPRYLHQARQSLLHCASSSLVHLQKRCGNRTVDVLRGRSKQNLHKHSATEHDRKHLLIACERVNPTMYSNYTTLECG